MRKMLLILVCFNSIMSFSQTNLSQRAFYSEYNGDVLFSEDTLGIIIFSDVAECDLRKDTILMNIQAWLYEYKNKYKSSVDNLYDGFGKFKFRTQVPVGSELFSTPAGVFPRASSKVEFTVCIEYKDNKFKYTLDEFYTFRRRMIGAKSEGTPNSLHWNRINKLIEEKDKYSAKKSKKAIEKAKVIEEAIEKEKKQYELEYKTIINIIDEMCTQIRMGIVSDF